MTSSTIGDVAAKIRFRSGEEFIVTAKSLSLILLHFAEEQRSAFIEAIDVYPLPARHVAEVE